MATAKASKNFYIIYGGRATKIFSFKKVLNFCWLWLKICFGKFFLFETCPPFSPPSAGENLIDFLFYVIIILIVRDVNNLMIT